jgi:hypothetical protein
LNFFSSIFLLIFTIPFIFFSRFFREPCGYALRLPESLLSPACRTLSSFILFRSIIFSIIHLISWPSPSLLPAIRTSLFSPCRHDLANPSVIASIVCRMSSRSLHYTLYLRDLTIPSRSLHHPFAISTSSSSSILWLRDSRGPSFVSRFAFRSSLPLFPRATKSEC